MLSLFEVLAKAKGIESYPRKELYLISFIHCVYILNYNGDVYLRTLNFFSLATVIDRNYYFFF